MNNSDILNCNLIKDLLPSYLDGICTPDTKKAVDQHLDSCPQCRRLTKIMQETVIVSEKLPSIEIDHFKKFKKNLTKSLTGGMLLTSIILFGLVQCMTNNIFSPDIFFWALPVLLIATNLLLPVSAGKNGITKGQKILAGIGVLVTCYSLLLSVISAVNALEGEKWLSFLEESQIGPFLSMQYHAASSYLAAAYIIETCHALRARPVSFASMSLYLTGSCTILAQDSCLHILSDYSSWIKLMASAAIIPLLEGTLITLIIQASKKNKVS